MQAPVFAPATPIVLLVLLTQYGTFDHLDHSIDSGSSRVFYSGTSFILSIDPHLHGTRPLVYCRENSNPLYAMLCYAMLHQGINPTHSAIYDIG
jgi:hypothetical protein